MARKTGFTKEEMQKAQETNAARFALYDTVLVKAGDYEITPWEDGYFRMRHPSEEMRYYPTLVWACKDLLNRRITDKVVKNSKDIIAAIKAAEAEVVAAITRKAMA